MIIHVDTLLSYEYVGILAVCWYFEKVLVFSIKIVIVPNVQYQQIIAKYTKLQYKQKNSLLSDEESEEDEEEVEERRKKKARVLPSPIKRVDDDDDDEEEEQEVDNRLDDSDEGPNCEFYL